VHARIWQDRCYGIATHYRSACSRRRAQPGYSDIGKIERVKHIESRGNLLCSTAVGSQAGRDGGRGDLCRGEYPVKGRVDRQTATRHRSAFTLTELLIVMGILALLAGLLLPAIQTVRKAAAKLQCSNNLMRLGFAVHSIHDSYRHYPGYMNRLQSHSRNHPPRDVSWAVLVLPYLEQQQLWEQWQQGAAIRSGATLTPFVQALTCPASSQRSDVGFGALSYRSNNGMNPVGSPFAARGKRGVETGANGIFIDARRRTMSARFVKDGKGCTILFTEQNEGSVTERINWSSTDWRQSGVTWSWLVDPNYQYRRDDRRAPPARECHYINAPPSTIFQCPLGARSASSNHGDGAQACLADASVHFLRETIDYTVWTSLMTTDHKRDFAPTDDRLDDVDWKVSH